MHEVLVYISTAEGLVLETFFVHSDEHEEVELAAAVREALEKKFNVEDD